ncbi:MAG: DUF222 domain-containing protein [Acidimicrobiia bacterium]
MPENLLSLSRALRSSLAAFDPKRCSGEDAAAIAEELAATVKACDAARVRATARAAECGVHRQKGFADAADWLARASGTSMGEAKTALATTLALEKMPETLAALTAGEVSLQQATVVAETEKECPGSERTMLNAARAGSLRSLKEKARHTQQAEIDPEELRRRRHRARSFRHWTDKLGMVGFAGELPPEVGLPLVNRIDAEADRLRRQAKRDGGAEEWNNYSADAFLGMVTGSGQVTARSADLVIVCDLRAFRRGHAHAGEPVHLIGGGPIPVSLVKELAHDAFLKAVCHDGVDLRTVKHFGRHIKAEIRTALELGRPPDFDGITCAEANCDRRYHLEWDHADPHANWGPNGYDNLQPLCWPHHREKTDRDRHAGLLGPRISGPDPP